MWESDGSGTSQIGGRREVAMVGVVMVGIVIALLVLAAIAFTLWQDGQGLPRSLSRYRRARRRPPDDAPPSD
nr:hypothetical protein [Streptomyces sp. 846.5]